MNSLFLYEFFDYWMTKWKKKHLNGTFCPLKKFFKLIMESVLHIYICMCVWQWGELQHTPVTTIQINGYSALNSNFWCPVYLDKHLDTLDIIANLIPLLVTFVFFLTFYCFKLSHILIAVLEYNKCGITKNNANKN